MTNGLKLHPDAPITGKIVRGKVSTSLHLQKKSWGYTSYHNSYWANGNDDTAIMGLYATAYGNPLDVNTNAYYTDEALRKKGKDCVHAHAGTQLRRDEIIFCNENAMVLNYIVEFA